MHRDPPASHLTVGSDTLEGSCSYCSWTFPDWGRSLWWCQGLVHQSRLAQLRCLRYWSILSISLGPLGNFDKCPRSHHYCSYSQYECYHFLSPFFDSNYENHCFFYNVVGANFADWRLCHVSVTSSTAFPCETLRLQRQPVKASKCWRIGHLRDDRPTSKARAILAPIWAA